MLKENIMNGKLPDENSAPDIGAGFSGERLKSIFEGTLNDLSVYYNSFADNCEIFWDKCKNADNYRVDIYRIEDRGPNMGCLNYIAIQSETVKENRFLSCRLEAMNSYRAVVSAFNGDSFIGRYPSIYCIVTPEIFGNMLSDYSETAKNPEIIKGDGSISFDTLPAEKSVLLNSNPDRGFRSEEDYFIPDPQGLKEWTSEKIFEDVKERIKKSTNGEIVKVSRVYFILDKYINTEVLPEILLDYIQNVYDSYRKLGVKLYLCHYYQHGIMGTENVTQETVLSHLKQLKPLFVKNEDVIFAMNFSFIGSYGEWTGIRNNIDRQVIVNAVMDAAPDDIRLIIRQPLFKVTFINKDFWRYNRIGFADDACHGLMFKSVDLGQGIWQPGTKWWELGVKESPYTINDTELFTTRWIRLSGSWPDGYSCMQSLSQKHTSTLSISHGYGDTWQFGGRVGETCLHGWKSQPVTSDILDGYGLAYSDNWFKDSSGEEVKRNAFEYLRDYLGYRITLKSADVKSKKDGISINFTLQNLGYTAAFNLRSYIELLDKDGNAVIYCEVGNPEEWYGTNPESYNDREILSYNIKAEFSNIPNGSYKVAFVMKNKLNQFARLDNDICFENGKNILFSIEL